MENVVIACCHGTDQKINTGTSASVNIPRNFSNLPAIPRFPIKANSSWRPARNTVTWYKYVSLIKLYKYM